ncbi:MAG: DDE-type integrase/transposase/recombinase [Nocardioides sp.]|nr:DDE-type integrase/transposase/recombinase [Nocardioides sp.]
MTDVYSRRIVGWNVAVTLKADILPLQALEMAAWEARREGATDLTGLVHDADHGSNYLSIVYTDRIGELGAKPSTGTVGDSFDNALAEAVNGLYKTELIRRRGPWRTIEQVELATLEYVWWWNNHTYSTVSSRCAPRSRSRRRTTLPKKISPASTRWPRERIGTKPSVIHGSRNAIAMVGDRPKPDSGGSRRPIAAASGRAPCARSAHPRPLHGAWQGTMQWFADPRISP